MALSHSRIRLKVFRKGRELETEPVAVLKHHNRGICKTRVFNAGRKERGRNRRMEHFQALSDDHDT